MGLIWDEESGRMRKTHGLILTLCHSRHMYVYLTFKQDIRAVIEGFEESWDYFGGITGIVSSNLSIGSQIIFNALYWTIGSAIVSFIGAGLLGFAHTLPQTNIFTHGTIVTAMNNVTNASFVHIGIVIAVFALMIFLTYLAFSLSDLIVKKIGNNLISVIGKLMGLILAISGTGMVIEGING